MTSDRPTNHIKYRADIDGLRAIAVLPVVLYHADIGPFGGGFVGVDVFFVISGYLITSLITDQIDHGTFSLRNFYLRRIRRIFPALFCMLTFCATVGWLLLTPQDYKLLGKSILATVLFSSNILFWRQSGYFDAPLEGWPLLHTWSLGVEEQFYLAFPIFLILIYRYLPHSRIAVTFMLCMASFALNILIVKVHPSAAFYLAPPRIWELFIGALLAMGILAPPRSAIGGKTSGILGVCLIGYAIFEFSKETTFPSFAALLPTFGAAGVIWGGMGPPGTATRFLSHRAPVFVGKISYSLYLWHFPLLAFGNYASITNPSLGARTMLIAVSVVLALGSWLYIERPVRQGRWVFRSPPVVFGSAAAALALFGSFGLALQFANGFPSRIGAHGLEILSSIDDVNLDRERCVTLEPTAIARRSPCNSGIVSNEPQFALWGDSHAESLRGAMDDAAELAQRSGVFLGDFGCVPEIGIERVDVPACRATNDAIIAYLLSVPSIQTVVLAGRWALWAEGSRYKREPGKRVYLSATPGVLIQNHSALETGLEHAVAALTVAGKHVWLVGPIPEIGYNVPRALFIDSLGISSGADIRPTLEEFNVRERFVLALFAKLAKKYSVHVIWPHQSLCDSRFCQVQKNDRPLYFDDQHLTRSASKSIAAIFDPIFAASRLQAPDVR